MGDTPIGRAQFALSGEGLRRRTDAAENRALNPTPRPKPKVKIKPKAKKTYHPPAAGVAAQKQRELAARAADEAAIKARGLRSK